MRSSVLLCFVLALGLWAVNCQEVEKEDKDGGSGEGPKINGIGTDDEDATAETSGDSIDIDDTTVPSTTNIQSEEPTSEDLPTTEEPTKMETTTKMEIQPTTDEEMTVTGSGETEAPTDDTEATTEATDDGTSTPPDGPTTPETTENNNEVDKKPDTTTPDPLPNPTTDESNEVDNIDVLGDEGKETNMKESDAAARKDQGDDDEVALSNLTGEVVAAIAVGAVCAIIIIAFLVYRLKKRDEGSYALDESTHYTNKDAYKFSAEGKEAFV